MNIKNAQAALKAAVGALDCGDSTSAIDYIAVAANEIVGVRQSGQPLVYATDMTLACVNAGSLQPVQPKRHWKLCRYCGNVYPADQGSCICVDNDCE